MESEVSIVNRHGEHLQATLTIAASSARAPGPAMLLCQGLSGVRNLVLPQVAAAFADAGISTLRFDYAGCGQSEGTPGWIDLEKRRQDAASALAWLRAHAGVDSGRVGVYGHSYGGPVAIGIAARDRQVRTLVAVSSPGSGEDLLRAARPAWEWIELRKRVTLEQAAIASGQDPAIVGVDEIFPFSPKFRAAYEKLKASQGGTSAMPGADGLGKTSFYLATVDLMVADRLDEAASHLSHCSALLISGAEDDTAPVEILAPVFERIPSLKQWHLVANADHNSLDTDPGLGNALRHVTAWASAELTAW